MSRSVIFMLKYEENTIELDITANFVLIFLRFRTFLAILGLGHFFFKESDFKIQYNQLKTIFLLKTI